MELQEPLRKILNKKYAPSALIETRWDSYDIAFKTDKEGDPMVLLMGHRDAEGNIRGERFARRLKQTITGTIIKDRWEYKGNNL